MIEGRDFYTDSDNIHRIANALARIAAALERLSPPPDEDES